MAGFVSVHPIAHPIVCVGKIRWIPHSVRPSCSGEVCLNETAIGCSLQNFDSGGLRFEQLAAVLVEDAFVSYLTRCFQDTVTQSA
jgi:hypothetical protein